MWFYFILIFILFSYLAAATSYLAFLAFVYFFVKEKVPGKNYPCNKFIVVVPAHNEEMLIANTIESLLQVDYPSDKYEIAIIADNCNDDTVAVCNRYPVKVLERNESASPGKGQALAWALGQVDLEMYDAVFFVDADNYVDQDILNELNKLINAGEKAIQCYNAVGNRDDSSFTQLLYVSRIIGNLLYHEPKFRLGLSSYLMGNGICFKADLLRKKGWTAFTVGEDWEYSAQLVESGIMIGFAAKARVFHQESRSLNQATSQRLRWSSGRFKVARTLGWRLAIKGIKQKDIRIVDAALPLIFPNYSLQLNLTFLGLFLSAFVLSSTSFFFVSFLVLIVAQASLFIAGAYIAGSPLKVVRAAFYAPFFLIWKCIVDVLCLTGLYEGKKWIRTRRHESKSGHAKNAGKK